MKVVSAVTYGQSKPAIAKTGCSALKRNFIRSLISKTIRGMATIERGHGGKPKHIINQKQKRSLRNTQVHTLTRRNRIARRSHSLILRRERIRRETTPETKYKGGLNLADRFMRFLQQKN